jgi:dolichol-phosphate mannosyltransferase
VRTLVVVPTYDEAPNIEAFLRRVREVVPAADVLVVDDNSPDGTADLAEAVGADVGQVKVLRRPGKDGLGNAYRAGIAFGLDEGYEALIQMDADFSHDPAVIPDLLRALETGAEVALGSRYVPGGSIPHWPAYRRALSRYGNRYAVAVLGLDVRDATAGYRAYRADLLRRIRYDTTRANGYGFHLEMSFRIAQVGARADEVPIVFTDRVRGTSKMSVRIMAESMALVTWWGARGRLRSFLGRRRPSPPPGSTSRPAGKPPA